MAASIANTTTSSTSRRRLLLAGLAVTLISSADAASSSSEQDTLLRRNLGNNYPCDPSRCVLVKFTFNEAATECASCWPYEGKWHCPADGKNAYSTAMDATFGNNAFGDWSGKCVSRSYDPSFLAFSGPSAWEDDIVPACPDAQFCACDDLKTKFETLLENPTSLSSTEQSTTYWASMASGFTLVQGFSDVSGGSWEYFDLVYQHGDGRRQFCAMPQSFTYNPQRGEGGGHSYKPTTYDNGCGYGGCDEDYNEISSEWCWWPPVSQRETCEAKLKDLTERTEAPERLPVTQAADTQKEVMNGAFQPWGECSKSCGGGTQTRYPLVSSGSGAHVSDPRPQTNPETRSCNTHQCCSWWQFWC